MNNTPLTPKLLYKITHIQEDFNTVISATQGIPEVNSNDLFNKWLEAKAQYINLLGDNFIYTIPELLTFDLDAESISNMYETIIERITNYSFSSTVKYFKLIDFLK